MRAAGGRVRGARRRGRRPGTARRERAARRRGRVLPSGRAVAARGDVARRAGPRVRGVRVHRPARDGGGAADRPGGRGGRVRAGRRRRWQWRRRGRGRVRPVRRARCAGRAFRVAGGRRGGRVGDRRGAVPAAGRRTGRAGERRVRRDARARGRAAAREVADGVRDAVRDAAFLRFTAATCAGPLLSEQATTVVPLRGAGSGGTTLFLCVAGVVAALIQPWCAARDRAARDGVVPAGFLVAGGSYAALIPLGASGAPPLAGLLAAALLSGIGMGLLMPSVFQQLVRHAPPGRSGAYFGVRAFLAGIVSFGGGWRSGGCSSPGPGAGPPRSRVSRSCRSRPRRPAP
ncbi:MFS transporter [Actinomadura yumaensis]|uniref:MFS transporter n=1 Tax=Actinomadura yumaensis TaxID=111807 RepID=UPI00361864FC